MTVKRRLVSRNELRERGLRYSNTHFSRLEKEMVLKPVKVGGRSSRVHYWKDEVDDLFNGKPRK